MREMIHTDILIVGGGPAGSTLAKYLSIGGIENVLVQRNFDFKKPCGGGIRLDAFDEFDIDKSLIKKRVDTIGLVHKDTKISVDISKTPLAIVDRVEFDTALRAEAENRGTRLYEAVFVSLEIFDDHVISKIKIKDRYVSVRSRYLIAADGVNSRIRKIIYKDKAPSLMTCYSDLVSKDRDICEFHFGKKIAGKHYAWVFPHSGGVNIGAVSGAEKTISKLKRYLDLDEMTRELGYKIPDFKHNIFYKERVFFVGDSASQVLPFTYEGIYYAISSAKILSEILLEKKAPQEYEHRWKIKHGKKFKTLMKLQNIFLSSELMIYFMMKLYKNRHIQEQMIELWLGKRELQVDLQFFFRIIKRAMRR